MMRHSAKGPWWLIFFLFGLFAWRIIVYHVMPDKRVTAQAQTQYWIKTHIKANRGTIHDRDGNLLALSVPKSSFFIDPLYWDPKNSNELRGILSEDIIQKLSQSREGRFLWVSRKVAPEVAEALNNRELKGIFEMKEKQRVYPNNSLMAHTIGYCDIDDRGQSGVEFALDLTLYEPPGYKVSSKKGLGTFEGRAAGKTGIPTVTLTLDAKIQGVVERALSEAVTVNAAKWGAAVCMDPNTGEIFAMASLPTFNPNDRSKVLPEATVNNVVARAYEPGSTLKPVIVAIALDGGFLVASDVFKCGSIFKVSDGSISEAYKGTAFGRMTAADVLIKSSNIGMAQIGLRMKPTYVYQSLMDWGFGRSSAIELSGVEKGLISPPSQWRGVTPANIAIGQGLAVTPLQLVTALAAVVNGGHLLKPYIVKTASDSDGNIIYRGERTLLRDVLSPSTSLWLRNVMNETTLRGTGRIAATSVVKIGTKTGTAQVAEKGKYGTGKYVSSIIGFWPADDPKYIALVVVGEPTKGKYYGGEIAGPPLRQIVEGIFELAPFTKLIGDRS